MNFKAYSKYYDLLYTGKDCSAEVTYIDTLIKRHTPAAKHILELCCAALALRPKRNKRYCPSWRRLTSGRSKT